MDSICAGIPVIFVYLDYEIIFSKTMYYNADNLKHVFNLVAKHVLKIKISNSLFSKAKLQLLGHTVNKDGISVDLEKVEAIRSAMIPKTTTELRSFLGLAGYYWRFIRGFPNNYSVLHVGKSGNRAMYWTEDMGEELEKIKVTINTPPVISFPNFDRPFVFETDSSYISLGAVRTQEKEDYQIHPIEFVSRTLN